MSDLELRVDLLAEEDVAEILEFERVNRAWFERWVPPRPEDYFELQGLRTVVRGLALDQEAGRGRFYLVRDGSGRLVGRVNLLKFGGGEGGSARLGYRVAGAEAGRGIATRAVGMVLTDVQASWDIHRVEASTILGNAASERVLEHNGFVLVRREPGGLELHGRRVDRLDYVRELGR